MGILRRIGIGLFWGTLLIVIGAATWGFFVLSRLDSEVQKLVLAELQKGHPDLDIRVGSARIVENRGLSIRDVEFSVPQALGQPRKLLHVGELFVECPITYQSFFHKKPQISRIVVKNPILRASRGTDGTFPELQLLAGGSEDSLFFFPEEGKPIVMEVENGLLLYDDVRQPAPPLRLSGINLAITPEMRDQMRCVPFKGTIDGDFFRRLDIDALYLPDTKQWQFTAHCRQFDWSDDLWHYIPQHPLFKERPLFQGRFDFDVSVVSDPGAEWGCRFAVGGTLAHGRMDFPKINRTLTELSTRFEVTNEKIVIDKLTGSGDSSRFAASYVQNGFSSSGGQQQAELTLNVRDLRFDDELIDVLSPFLNDETKRLLAQYHYKGTTDVHAQLSCQNGRWHPKNLSMQIAEIGFAHRDFPYHLDRLSGNLYIDESAALHFHFASKQDTPLKAAIDGHYVNIFEDAAGKVEITGEDVPIDAKLLRALPLSTQQVVQSLQPSGRIKARLIFELPPGDVPISKQFDIVLDHVSLRYEHFPYPLRDVTGLLHCAGNVWHFRDVLGSNGTALFRGTGLLRPIGGVYRAAQEFVLNISAEELPVDDQIAQALLHSEQRQLLQSLNVNGKVNLAAQIQYRTDDRQLNLHFQADPCPGLSITPNRFPYKIENVTGAVQYENGRVFAETLTGTHRNTTLRSGLDCQFNAEGASILRLTPLTIDQLQTDREFLDALPKHLRDSLEPMQITKPFNLSGGIEYQQTPQGEFAVHWDLNWILHQNSLKMGIPLENVFGMVRLRGHSATDQLQLNGDLYLDSFMVSGFPVTNVRGPFFFDNKQHLRLGVPENLLRPDIVSQPLMGNFCGGTIRADGLVIMDKGITYSLQAELAGADLAKMTQVVEPTAQNTSGTLDSNIQLQGIGTKWETVSGTGSFQLRDAN
ncbi:MAG: hypothetical protein LBI05_12190, partial [Planctomycetaceae bacterium]|nr:hypothetical protein [Planctomycetaceae bacterium]